MKYQYKTVKGKIEVEVDEQLYSILDAMDTEEHNSNRRYYDHYSICDEDFIEEMKDEGADVLDILIQSDDRERLYKALSQLTLDQQKLIERVYQNNEKIVEIARALGVSQPTISKKLILARKKLKNNF